MRCFLFFLLLIAHCGLLAQYAPGDTLINHALSLLGKPYRASTLENVQEEKLIISNDAFDCYTFVERSLALSIGADNLNQSTTFLRYKNGLIDGFCSRLHYLSEWIHYHIANGLLIDITPGLEGARLHTFDLNFMSAHPQLYPAMLRDSCVDVIKKTEKEISGYSIYVVPKEKVNAAANYIQHGDIIAITTRKRGLDYSHVGLAYKKKGKLYLLHASTTGNITQISSRTLYAYLMRNNQQTGITVLRWTNKKLF